MAATKWTTANLAKAVVRAMSEGSFVTVVSGDHGPASFMNQLMHAIQQGISGHQHTETSADTDSLNTGDARQLTSAELTATLAALVQGTPGFVVGAEGGDIINVSCQLKDCNGVNLAAAHVVQAWLSDTAGAAVTADPPSGAVAIGAAGTVIAEHTAKTHLVVATNAAGLFDLNIAEAGVDTWYLNVEYAGKVFSSAAITFA